MPQKSTYNLNLIFLVIAIIAILINPFIIVHAGERGVLMQFGKVENMILGEGIHPVIPLVNTVKKLTVRIQKQEISAEASSKDLQEIFADVALNWHIVPEEVNEIFKVLGNETDVIEKIISPAVEEVLKAVMAEYTAEEIITKRGEVKDEVDHFLKARLENYHIKVDEISLVHVHFSERFSDAVEAKQIAEQEAKKAGFAALRAIKEAEAMVNLAKGEAEAQRLLQDSLTPEIIEKEMIKKWNGQLPLITGSDDMKILDLKQLMKLQKKR